MDRQNRALSIRKGKSPFPLPQQQASVSRPRAPPTPPNDSEDEDRNTKASPSQYYNNFDKTSSRYATGRQRDPVGAPNNYYNPSSNEAGRQQQRPPTPPRDPGQSSRTSPRVPQGPFQGTRRRQPSEPTLPPRTRPRQGSDASASSTARVRDRGSVQINFTGLGGPNVSFSGRGWGNGTRDRQHRRWDNDDEYHDDYYYHDDDRRPRITHIHTPFISTPFGFGGDRPRAGFLNLNGFGIF